MSGRPRNGEASLRGRVIGCSLGIASAVVVVWQVNHVAVLYDLSFILNDAFRVASGDVPYRDFPLVYPPLTLAVQALLIRAFGPHYLVQSLYAVLLCGVATALTFWIVLRIVGDAWEAGLLCLPLAFLGIQDIYPHPLYDPDATFLMLVAIATVLWAGRTVGGPRWAAAGALLAMPIFAKQNTGVAFAVLMTCAIVLSQPARTRAATLTGAAIVLIIGAAILQAFAGLDNVVRWAIGSASVRIATAPPLLGWLTDPMSILLTMLVLLGLLLLGRSSSRGMEVLASACILLPFALIVSFSVILPELMVTAWPVILLVACVTAGRAVIAGSRAFETLLSFVVLGVATAAFASQGANGSSYALWPLLPIALAAPLRMVSLDGRRRVLLSRAVIPIATALMLIGGFAYTLGEARLLTFVQLAGDPVPSRWPSLTGLTTPGPFMPELDAALDGIAQLIPASEAFIAFPGEDPLYFALARKPGYPVLQFDPTTDPYSATELREMRDTLGIRWVLVKRSLQLSHPTRNFDTDRAALVSGFDFVAIIGGYDVYRRP